MRKLPQCIIQLRSLKHLDLWDNKISELPAAIGELHQLESLELGFNPLTTLPESFLRLTNLQRLDLSDTEIRKLPPVVLQLRRLITLDLSNNGLTELPEGLRMLTQLKELHLHSNESLNLPREILGSRSHETSPENPPVAAERILEYYFRTRGAPRPLNEAKLVLVGFGGVGKTSLVRRLINDQFDQHEPKTEGIDINV
jgi:Leucine-rich repeat (LRR) protein